MTASPSANLTVVGAAELPSALVIDVPTGMTTEVRQLVEQFGARLEELLAAVAGQVGDKSPSSSEWIAPPASPVRLPVGTSSGSTNPATCLDLRGRSVSRNNEKVHLTNLEFELLVYFARNPRRAINRDELLDHVWNEPVHVGRSRTVDVHIRRLRGKLGPEFQLTTVRGFGYRLDEWDAIASNSAR